MKRGMTGLIESILDVAEEAGSKLDRKYLVKFYIETEEMMRDKLADIVAMRDEKGDVE